MSKASLRQPVVLYSMLFTMFIAFAVVLIATFELVEASRRAYRRAVIHDLRALAGSATLGQIRKRIVTLPNNVELERGVVTATSSAFGIDLKTARSHARYPSNRSPFVVIPIAVMASADANYVPGSRHWRIEPDEAYLVGRIDPAVPRAIAFAGTSRMIPLVLFGALACAAFLSFMLGRLLLPPLTRLAELARETRVAPGELATADAPNEILEVARRFRDTVRRLNQERELVEEQRNELERMQASLIRASKLASVGRLAAGIAHEIGNPLAAVQGYMTLMQSGLDSTDRADVLERSEKELGRISDTIRKLLTYARGGEEPSEPLANFSSGRVVDEALALVRSMPALKHLEIDNEVEGHGETDVIGHADRLNQVLVNLLLNAGHALENVESPRIRIGRSTMTGIVQLEIEDNGLGVPPESLEHIFDPFYTTKDPGEGTGLGLAVSRALMEAMGGDLMVDSGRGRGALFKVRLRPATQSPPKGGQGDG